MGNGITKNPCFSGEPYAAAVTSDSLPNDSHGHSFTYVPSGAGFNQPRTTTMTSSGSSFFSLSGASISANPATPASMPSFPLFNEMTWPPSTACIFTSSRSFAAIPFQATTPRPSMSGPILRTSGRISETSGSASTTFDSPFMSRPLDRSSSSFVAMELQPSISQLFAERRAACSHLRDEQSPLGFSVNTSSKKLRLGSPHDGRRPQEFAERPIKVSSSDGDYCSPPSHNVEWAQGVAGEDRLHIALSEEHNWVFVGIYDGFYGPDAADYLFANLYVAVHSELKGLFRDDEIQAGDGGARCCQQEAGKGNAAAADATPPVHRDVLRALARALKKTEEAFFAAAEEHADESPELGMMGSCVLVMVMKGRDVYLMSVGDSRAVLARRPEPDLRNVLGKASQDLQLFKSEMLRELEAHDMDCLQAVQLTAEHSTAIQEEVTRIKGEHLNDRNAIVNGRVKGKINVTRAFGVAYLKQPKWNDRLLGAFKVNYVGTEPYVSCAPSLCHHRVGSPQDKFLVLSSDGLYDYFTNKEVVDMVEAFAAAAEPGGDPAQHLVGELVRRAASKAGMEPWQLLEIPRGERRRYHDDVSIVVISFEGPIWRSSV